MRKSRYRLFPRGSSEPVRPRPCKLAGDAANLPNGQPIVCHPAYSTVCLLTDSASCHVANRTVRVYSKRRALLACSHACLMRHDASRRVSTAVSQHDEACDSSVFSLRTCVATQLGRDTLEHHLLSPSRHDSPTPLALPALILNALLFTPLDVCRISSRICSHFLQRPRPPPPPRSLLFCTALAYIDPATRRLPTIRL